MNAKELFEKVSEKAKEFGLIPRNEDPKGNAIIRKNLFDKDPNNQLPFFGFCSKDEEITGLYSDFSFVVFPEKELGVCVVSLGVGTLGFKNDYQLASQPGLRRRFLKLKTDEDDDTTFFKTSFDDIEGTSPGLKEKIREVCPNLETVIEKYQKVLPACRIINFGNGNEEDNLAIIYTWLATYAQIRGWGNSAQKKKIAEVLENIEGSIVPNDEEEVKTLLSKRRYVVLQGAPGTGKTYTALKIAGNYNKIFMEQFHAETTFSDFVYGLEPNLNAQTGDSQFKEKEGILYKAMKYAKEHQKEKVLLIIDEINRANLSNVLGPVFFLFEFQSEREIAGDGIQIGNEKYKKLPDNLHVIATMNTADRSLAVVDFALRRRFAWYTLRPHKIKPEKGKKFDKRLFNKFADIFFEFATDDELNLQPGHSYFIYTDKVKMIDRLIYELMPLIKEYLAEGYLAKAKDSFCEFFLKETGKLMYE